MQRACSQLYTIGNPDALLIGLVVGVAFACAFLTPIFYRYTRKARGYSSPELVVALGALSGSMDALNRVMGEIDAKAPELAARIRADIGRTVRR